MTPERWRQITEVFHLARARDTVARAAFLDETCAGDVELRAEVEALLAADGAADGFGNTPLFASHEPPRFERGDRLGPYEIERLMGTGGMGEVYRAHDARLDRDVAIKVLSATTSRETDARLLREARAAAALNHPHVCTIHEVGESDGHAYIAMELIEGHTLDQLIPAGGLPLDDVLRYGLQIAEAIAHAHERGIVHRDLKPANVMISELGIAKVLDFGLAKVLPLAEQPRLAFSATHTVAGLVIGTAAYMSPEQALGHSTDERSDIFSFGGVLYEMATGRPAFTGATPMEVLDAVLHAEPQAAAAARSELPAELLQVIQKALAKDPAQRYQHMSEVAADLRRTALPTSRIRRSVRTFALAARIAVIAALIWIALPTVMDRASIDDTPASRQKTTSLPAYRAVTEARGLYAAARWEAALASTQRALDLDPDYADAWALLGKIYIRGLASPPGFPGGSLEDYRSHALTAARRAIELDPSSYDGRVALALAHRERAQIESSRAAARQAIELNPGMAEAYAVLGDSYGDNTAWGCAHDRDSALTLSYYRRALSIEPANHLYHMI